MRGGQGAGARALLACPEGESHDLGLISFGLALRARGWRIDFLGNNTPTESIVEAARSIKPELVVVSATTRNLLSAVLPRVSDPADGRRLALAGAGAEGLPDVTGVLTLTGDPVSEARRLSELVG